MNISTCLLLVCFEVYLQKPLKVLFVRDVSVPVKQLCYHRMNYEGIWCSSMLKVKIKTHLTLIYICMFMLLSDEKM